jgi:hypothetical protein
VPSLYFSKENDDGKHHETKHENGEKGIKDVSEHIGYPSIRLRHPGASDRSLIPSGEINVNQKFL